MVKLTAIRGNGDGPAPMDTHPTLHHTAGLVNLTLRHFLNPPTAKKQQNQIIAVALLQVRINEAFVVNVNKTNMLLQLSLASLHALVNTAAPGYSNKKKSFLSAPQHPGLLSSSTPTFLPTNPTRSTHVSDNPVYHDAASYRMARNTDLHRLSSGDKTQRILAPNDSQTFYPT